MRPKWFEVIIFVGVWSAWTIFMSALIAHDERIPFFYAFNTNVVLFGIAALLSLPVLRFGSWLASRRRNAFIAIAIVVACCMLYATAWTWTASTFFLLAYGSYFVKNIFDPMSVWIFLNGVVVCGVIFGVAYARRHSQNLHQAELNRAKLQYLAKESELRALRSQFNPHFLFNALNSVYAMIDSEPTEARNMLVRLSELLRLSLSASNVEFLTLKEDCEFAQRYLEVEKVRLGDRLNVETDIDDDVLSEKVPSLILQPIVENAIKHGASKTELPVTITISAKRRGAVLELGVSDTGAGMDQTRDDIESTGYGLRNLRARLEKIYGDRYRLTYANGASGGFDIRIELPGGGNAETSPRDTASGPRREGEGS